MTDVAFGCGVFVCPAGAFLLAPHLQDRLPPRHLPDDTLVGVIATLIALVLSPLITTVQDSFNGAERDLRSYDGRQDGCRPAGGGAAGALIRRDPGYPKVQASTNEAAG